MSRWDFQPYEPVAQKKAKAGLARVKMQKNDLALAPVIIEGRDIAKTWWGKAWCKNLESYADYSNRIGRGRSYVRNGAVLDLKIGKGLVQAKIIGTRVYDAEIRIDTLSEELALEITGLVGRQIDSMSDLLEGKFPDVFKELFLTQKKGLFPSPNEIHLYCSCPDWASLCKHLAAALYGVGARLDEDPMLFFTLRGLDVSAFVKASVEEKIETMLKNAGNTTDRVIEDADLSALFGL